MEIEMCLVCMPIYFPQLITENTYLWGEAASLDEKWAKKGRMIQSYTQQILLSEENTVQGVLLFIPTLPTSSTVQQHIKGWNTQREL